MSFYGRARQNTTAITTGNQQEVYPDPGDPNTIGNANVIVTISRKDRYGEQDERKGSYETSATNFCSPTDCARMSEIY